MKIRDLWNWITNANLKTIGIVVVIILAIIILIVLVRRLGKTILAQMSEKRKTIFMAVGLAIIVLLVILLILYLNKDRQLPKGGGGSGQSGLSGEGTEESTIVFDGEYELNCDHCIKMGFDSIEINGRKADDEILREYIEYHATEGIKVTIITYYAKYQDVQHVLEMFEDLQVEPVIIEEREKYEK